MKTIAALTLSLFALAPVQAQVFRPETVNGAVLGGIAGAVIGNNSGDLHHNAWRGAAIGTVAGGLIGSAVGESRDRAHHAQVPVPSGYYSHAPAYRSSYGFGYGYGRPYGYRSGYYGYASPGYYYSDYGYGRPSYASSGLLLGGLTGAIIGNNSHGHNAWRGAAWGAGAGLLIGAIADANTRDREEQIAVAQDAQAAAAVQNAATTQSTPQNVTIINNYYGSSATPMSSANGMFGR
jgi:outer membrane lipoprotein SlyB